MQPQRDTERERENKDSVLLLIEFIQALEKLEKGCFLIRIKHAPEEIAVKTVIKSSKKKNHVKTHGSWYAKSTT